MQGKRTCFIIWCYDGDYEATGRSQVWKIYGGPRRENVWNCLIVFETHCCDIPEAKEMSFVEPVIAVMRAFKKWVSNIDDISELQENDKRQLRRAILGWDDYGGLMRRALGMDMIIIEKRNKRWFEQQKFRCLRCIRRDWKCPSYLLGSGCEDYHLECTVFHTWTFTEPSSPYIKNAQRDCNWIFFIAHHVDKPRTHARRGKAL